MLALIAILCTGPPRPPACTCVRPVESITTAATLEPFVVPPTTVFAGRVQAVTYRRDTVDVAGRRTPFLTMIDAMVVVDSVWTGDVGATVTVTTPLGAEACGADLAEGQSYLFFALPDAAGRLDVGTCDPTRRFDETEHLRGYLRELGHRPHVPR